MTDARAIPSQAVARLAGLLYLGTIAGGLFAEGFARSPLFVRGNAAATAANIIAQQPLYRAGLLGDLLMLSCYIGVTAIFYVMFKPVGRTLSLVAAGFSMTGIAVLASAGLLLMAPLHLLGSAPWLYDVPVGTRQGLTLLALSLHGDGYAFSLVFFGIYCMLLGWLIVRSDFLPWLIGALMALAGLCYLAVSLTDLAAPAARLPPEVMYPTLIGEGALALWLMVFGVKRVAAPGPR